MQQSIYKTKFRETFPSIEPVIQGDALGIFRIASSVGLQERYVTKTDKLKELEKEKDLALKLKEKKDLLWGKLCASAGNDGEYRYKNLAQDPNVPHIRCQPLWYSKYKAERIWEYLQYLVTQNEVLHRYPLYWDLAKKLCANVDMFYENVCVAADKESKGTAGEDAVCEYIKRMSTSRILQSVVLKASTGDAAKTAESDLVIVTANGIYVCEIKNYGKAGNTLQIDADGTFRKLDSRGNWLKDHASPFAQNDRHCQAIHQVLLERDMSDVPIHPVVVISNTDVNIQNNSNMLVIDQYQLGEMIRSAEQASVLSPCQIADAYKAIQEKRIEERTFPIMGVPYEMYDFCLGALLRYVEENDQWVSDCSVRLTEWADACNRVWIDMNRETIVAENAKKEKKDLLSIFAVLLVIALIIWLICTFWEQIVVAIGFALLIGLFALFLG